MTPAAVLLVYALLLAGVAAPLLRGASWVDRAPRLGIAAWQVLTASTLLSVVLAGLAPIVSRVEWSGSLASLLRACGLALHARYAVPGGVLMVGLGAALALAVTLRAGWCVLSAFVVAARQRRYQRDMLALGARHDPGRGALVVDNDAVGAYCLPGRGQQVVLTSAAVAALDERELRAVLAHERAHLRERHHLVLAGARALERAFAVAPMFRYAQAEIERLVEMAADDVASRGCERRTVATALVALAESSAPAAALAAAGSAAAARVRRLLTPTHPLSAPRRMLGFAAVSGLLVVPLVIAAGPAVAVAQLTSCPLEPASCLP